MISIYTHQQSTLNVNQLNVLKLNLRLKFFFQSLLVSIFLVIALFDSHSLIAQGVVDPGVVGPGSGGNNPVTCQLDGPDSVIVGHSADFVITASGGVGSYRYFGCHQCKFAANQNQGLPVQPVQACPPGPFSPYYNHAENVYVICGNPVGTLSVFARAEDGDKNSSEIVEKTIEVLPPDRIRVVNKNVNVGVSPNANNPNVNFAFTISPVFEIDIMRGPDKIGPCATICLETKDWYPAVQPGIGWKPKRDEPSFSEIPNCNCSSGLPAVNCISGPTHYARLMAGPFTAQEWRDTPINHGRPLFRMAFKTKYIFVDCVGNKIELESGLLDVRFYKTSLTNVRVSIR